MPPPKRATTAAATESDIATNAALLHHAEATRLARSWLSGFLDENTTSPDAADKEKQEDEEEDLKYFGKDAFYSETGGIGFRPPVGADGGDGTAGSRGGARDSTTTAFLRRQLLRGGGRPTTTNAHSHTATTARPRGNTHAHENRHATGAHRRIDGGDSEDENEESRSGVGKGKKRKTNGASKSGSRPDVHSTNINTEPEPTPAPVLDPQAGTTETGDTTADPVPNHNNDQGEDHSETRTAKKRGTSYLDEILASRAAKKKKKTKKKGGQHPSDTPG